MAFTFFFRDSYTLEQAINQLLPRVAGKSSIKVWNAGCAMGPETFTFAIMLAERIEASKFSNVHIDATDIDENEKFGDTITAGIYPYESLKRIPEDLFAKYFFKIDGTSDYRIDDNILSKVKFTQNDLLKLSPIGNTYNLVICKNVLLHFQMSERIEVFKMYHNVLDVNGLLVTEQTQPMPDECKHLFEKITSDANIFLKL